MTERPNYYGHLLLLSTVITDTLNRNTHKSHRKNQQDATV